MKRRAQFCERDMNTTESNTKMAWCEFLELYTKALDAAELGYHFSGFNDVGDLDRCDFEPKRLAGSQSP